MRGVTVTSKPRVPLYARASTSPDLPSLARKTGVPPGLYHTLTKSKLRKRVAAAVGGVDGSKIRGCGVPLLVELDGCYSYIFARCRVRTCPRCAFLRSIEMTRALESWVSGRGDLLFATLTQPQIPVESESANEAVTRLFTNLRRTFNRKYASGRSIGAVCQGGVRAVEVTWSARGWKTDRDGTRRYKASSGWHPHAHVLLQPVAGAGLGELASAVMRAWLASVPGAEPGAQYLTRNKRDRIHELCKYCVKPLEIRNKWRLREAAHALAGRKMIQSFGDWSRWMQAGSQSELPSEVRPTGVTFSELRNAAVSDRCALYTVHLGHGVTAQHAIPARLAIQQIAARPYGVYKTTSRIPMVSVTWDWLLAADDESVCV